MVPPPTESEVAAERPHQPQESLYRDVEKQLQFYRSDLPSETEIEILMGDPAEEIIGFQARPTLFRRGM
ncbi:MAG: hypothetical protein BRC56_00690 [Cyanobacteria bacterium SW_9_47_5]|nr:MAG: hypothetical protein BRC56_00690 [Cyanobacteria bacterium SW_9_47_5]